MHDSTSPALVRYSFLATVALVVGIVLVRSLDPNEFNWDYGQRENLLFIVLVPYLFSAAARIADRPLSAALAA
jgi:hypothetical protein